MPLDEHRFASRHELAEALAGRVAGALDARIGRDGRASLAVSGGTTPRGFLTVLGARPLAWDRVTVTLVDDRWVDQASERSNARLVGETLLAGAASAARFVPLCTGDQNPEAGLAAAERALAAVPRPFAAVVLGMGGDGHTASWFSGGDRLAQATDRSAGRRVETMRAAAAGEPRITLTLAAVLETDVLVLHIEGEAKRVALEAALGEGPVAAMPVRAVLRQDLVPVEVYWCP